MDEETAAAIRRVFNEEGELSAVVELRRHFPLITDMARGRECVRIIAGGAVAGVVETGWWRSLWLVQRAISGV